MPQKFFITHSWKDIEFARKLSNDLCASGLDGFLDAHSMNPGDSIPSRIERGLKECDVYIPIFSPDALKSDWCDWEIDMAITMNRTRKGHPRIIPVIAKPCNVPDRLIHLLYVSFVGRYDDALNELLTKGFGLPPKPLPSVVLPPPPAIPLRTQSLPTWFFPVSAVVAILVVLCILSSFVVNSIVNNQTPVPPTRVAVGVPTTAVPTIVPTQTPTQPPKPTDTPRPTATLTPKPTDTPRPTAITTLGIGSSKASRIDGATMMFVPAGDFPMGSNDNENERPVHTVYLDGFWIDKYEVTNGLYKKCVSAEKCWPPYLTKSFTRDPYYGNSQYDNYPVIYVSWYDANAFCNWAGKELPTEAQWEKAARGIDGRIYPWGNAFDKNLLNISAEGGKGDTTAVGSYPNGASPYGVMDMAGNVWEWVADWYDEKYYAGSPRNNPQGPSLGQYRVLRGGAWGGDTGSGRAAERWSGDTLYWLNIIGFRCVE